MAIRVVFHNPASILGGGELGLLNVIESLRTQIDPLVIIPGSGPLDDELVSRDISRIHVSMPLPVARIGRRGNQFWSLLTGLPWIASYLRASYAAIAAVKPQLLWSNGVKSHVVCSVVSSLLRIPLICHVRDVLGPVVLLRHLLRLVPRLIITPSHAAVTALGVRASQTRVVPNVVDLVRFDAQLRDPVPAPWEHLRSDFLVVAVGKVVPIKGYAVLINAWKQVVERLPSARLAIVGGEDYVTQGGHTAELRQLVDELGLSNTVTFTGEIRPVAPLLREAAVVVSSSRSEGFGRAVLEAMAAGRAVVATSVGGIPEFVKHDRTGFLVPVDDHRAMADALLVLLTDSHQAQSLGRAARRAVEESHQLACLRRELVSVIDEVVS